LPKRTTQAEGTKQLTDIRRRVNWSERLVMGLANELSIIRKGADPLLYHELPAVGQAPPARAGKGGSRRGSDLPQVQFFLA
jgi:hypothetical protein